MLLQDWAVSFTQLRLLDDFTISLSTRPPTFDFRASSMASEHWQIGKLRHVFCGHMHSIGGDARRRSAHLQRKALDWLSPTSPGLPARSHFPILDGALWRNPVCAPVQLHYHYCAHNVIYVHRSEWQRERAQTDGEEIKKEISELPWGFWSPFPLGTALLARFFNYPCVYWISYFVIRVHGVKWVGTAEDISLEIGQLENSHSYRWLEQGSRHGWCYWIVESPPQYMKNTAWWWKTTPISQRFEGILDTDYVLCVNLCSSQRERKRDKDRWGSRETGKRPISWAPSFMIEFIWGFITEDNSNSQRKTTPWKMFWKRDGWELTEENDSQGTPDSRVAFAHFSYYLSGR